MTRNWTIEDAKEEQRPLGQRKHAPDKGQFQ